MQGARSIKHLLGLRLSARYICIQKHLWGSDFSKFEMGLKICHAIFRPNNRKEEEDKESDLVRIVAQVIASLPHSPPKSIVS